MNTLACDLFYIQGSRWICDFDPLLVTSIFLANTLLIIVFMFTTQDTPINTRPLVLITGVVVAKQTSSGVTGTSQKGSGAFKATDMTLLTNKEISLIL